MRLRAWPRHGQKRRGVGRGEDFPSELEGAVYGLEGTAYEEQLRTLGLSSVGQRRQRGHRIALCSFQRGVGRC